jgi:uncharacterized protein YraI
VLRQNHIQPRFSRSLLFWNDRGPLSLMAIPSIGAAFMTPRLFLAASALAAALALPSVAAAVPGFTTGNVNVRTGPGTQYQAIATAPAGSGVDILGCMPGRTWCDIVLGNLRGWVSGRYVQEGGAVVQQYVVPRYVAPSPVVRFSFGNTWYDDDDDWRWRSHYRPRHRHHDRDDWDDRDRDRDRDDDGRDGGGWDGRNGGEWSNRMRCINGRCGPFGK